MKADILKILVFFAMLVAIVLLVSGEPTTACVKTTGNCAIYNGV